MKSKAPRMAPTLSALVICFLALFLTTCGAQCPHRCRCDRLNTVDCSGLALSELPSFQIWPKGATRLLLQKNRIRTLESGAFQYSGLVNLTTIDLSDNILDDIEPRAFNGLHKVVLLDLQRNRLRTLTGQAFSGLGGKPSANHEQCRVDLRHNDLRVIKENAFAWVKHLSLVFGKSQVPLTIKPYAFYSMHSVPSITFSGIKELTILPRAFTNFEQLGKLELSDSTITAIHNFTFEGLTDLGGLHIHNCTIRRLETYAFAGIKYAQNATTQVMPKERNYANGGYFIISKSDFPVLPQDAFRNTNLASVTLSDNSMKFIEAFAFRDMENLKFIHIRNNSLETLSTNSLASVRNLEEIILHGNKISNIEEYAFRDSGSIKTLSIGHSREVQLTLQPHAFSLLFVVDVFEITNLSKLIIMPNAFKDVIKVNRLKIESVFLPTLQRNSFNGLRQVGSFHIAFCNVTTIQPGAFGQGSRSRSAIDTFDLSQGNRIQCGCDIRRVLSEFQSTFTRHSSVQCVKVSESGTLVPVPLQQVPVCAGCALSMNIILLVCSILSFRIFT